ncbi:YggS family pyridoxal phosphate-dependent enzyme [Aliidiomarina halalkaliphila]|uniref:Pyridoxal phosphate homeostasis protein n=1 Tax=Aliidiomarina halalkaliphila TaxID=2593535 RepID=A0A552WZ39_9GAMM|nr:YggS family pyridoxal phosphate-dependent enzyme [Aliidiomarina halalkaliphila]TRW47946.1 YggS family pyridoxal phosphate-dependent enzyme [Aliidiomarina halalkaliphila]
MTPNANAIAMNLTQVRQQITDAAQEANRTPESIALLAVSKTKPVSAIRAAYAAGQRLFAENYVQEGVNKIHECQDLDGIQWHFVGPIQSNKTKDIAEHFDWVHSIDREKIARRLNEQRLPRQAPLQVLIQVNIDDEASKAGITLHQIDTLASFIRSCPHLQLRGLMAIPRANSSENEQASSFSALQHAFLELQQGDPKVDTLSLGMSGDLASAIKYGSTMVRIGTAIFGARERNA